jgi:hypothetical protein
MRSLSCPMFAIAALLALSSCDNQAAIAVPPEPPATNLKLVAGIQDIMALQIDPAADAIWESVSITVTKDGSHEHKPLTDDDWKKARGHALLIVEGSNLLLMNGRRVTREGVTQLEDHGTPGNLTAAESQAAIEANRDAFVSFAKALRGVGEELLTAIEARNVDGMLEAGETMDQVCETCHLKFWYPGQKIPRFPDEAPEEDLPSTKN